MVSIQSRLSIFLRMLLMGLCVGLYYELMLGLGASYYYDRFYLLLFDEIFSIGTPILILLILPLLYLFNIFKQPYQNFRVIMVVGFVSLAFFLYLLYRALLPWIPILMAVSEIDNTSIVEVTYIRDNCAQNAHFINLSMCFTGNYGFRYKVDDQSNFQAFTLDFSEKIKANSSKLYLFEEVSDTGWLEGRVYVDGLTMEERQNDPHFDRRDTLKLKPNVQARVP